MSFKSDKLIFSFYEIAELDSSKIFFNEIEFYIDFVGCIQTSSKFQAHFT